MIIDTVEELNNVQQSIQACTVIVIPVQSDNSTHYLNNTLSLIYFYVVETKKSYIYPLEHSESFTLPYNINFFQASKQVYVYRKKEFKNTLPGISLELLYNYYGRDLRPLSEYTTNAHRHIERYFYGVPNINEYVPVVKQKEVCDLFISGLDLEELISLPITTKLIELDQDLEDSIYRLEKVGLPVDVSLFQETFPKYTIEADQTRVYTEYNPYTKTFRPSSHFNGVNFAALNKKDGTRDTIMTEFGDEGALVSVDYSSYHVQLLAKLLAYEFPEEDLHTYFAKQYFPGVEITEELRDSSKGLTFKHLYSISRDNTLPLFFKKVHNLATELYNMAKSEKGLQSTIYSRPFYTKIKDYPEIAENMMFNYFIQNLETERNIKVLKNLMNMLESCKTNCIMYTYDAFLFDVHKEEFHTIVPAIKNIVEAGGYPVTLHYGKRYGTMG
jgi:hypothetical protein